LVAAGYAQVTLHGVRFANGSGLRLRHLVTENDITDFLGREIGLLLIDEGAHFTESSYRILRTRCRVSGEVAKCGLWPKIIVAAMPGGLGHLWVRRTWVDRGPFEIWRTPESEGGLLRQFLRSRLEDNPSLLSANPTYRQQLEGLGDPIIDACNVTGRPDGDFRQHVRELAAGPPHHPAVRYSLLMGGLARNG
jgi:hypothetical protein